MARLVCQSGDETGREYTLSDGIVLGRSSSNPICVDDHLASREHCKIVKEEDRYRLVDLESHNGTRVNEVKTRRHELLSGDVIRIGKIKFRFESDGPPITMSGKDPGQVKVDTPQRKRLFVPKPTPASTQTGYWVLLLIFFIALVFLSKSVGYSIAKRALEDTKPAIATSPE